MTPDRCLEQILEDEGFKPYAYLDSEGYWTIGHGILIDERKGGGITREESRYLASNRLAKARLDLGKSFPWYDNLDQVRRDALAMMAYQMGVEGVRKFRLMLKHMEEGDYGSAADEAMDSKWAEQTPARAYRVSQMIRNGD